MEITRIQRDEVERIIKEMGDSGNICLKNFECYHSSFEDLCKIKGIGTFDEVECLCEDARCCGESFQAVSKRYCVCPLRKYISANFRR